MDERYSRQILFPGIGLQGQQRLTAASVAIVGVGATGAAAANLLARAGVGHLRLIDRDIVEPSNLQRQILFDEQDAAEATPKAEAARRKIALFNSSVHVDAVVSDLIPANIAELLGPDPSQTSPHQTGPQLILDCTDNFQTRYLINDFAISQGIPWIYAGAVGAYAATMNILPRTLADAPYPPTACLACLFPVPPAGTVETCDTSGILAQAVTLAASLQTTEALKFLTGQPERMRRTFLTHDLWSNHHSEVAASLPDPRCVACGERRFVHLAGLARPHITLCGRNSVQIHESTRTLNLPDLHAALLRQTELQQTGIQGLRLNDLMLRFRRGEHTVTVFRDGRALIQGTTDISLARSLYARFIGA